MERTYPKCDHNIFKKIIKGNKFFVIKVINNNHTELYTSNQNHVINNSIVPIKLLYEESSNYLKYLHLINKLEAM